MTKPKTQRVVTESREMTDKELEAVAGGYTLATQQINTDDLPREFLRFADLGSAPGSQGGKVIGGGSPPAPPGAH